MVHLISYVRITSGNIFKIGKWLFYLTIFCWGVLVSLKMSNNETSFFILTAGHSVTYFDSDGQVKLMKEISIFFPNPNTYMYENNVARFKGGEFLEKDQRFEMIHFRADVATFYFFGISNRFQLKI